MVVADSLMRAAFHWLATTYDDVYWCGEVPRLVKGVVPSTDRRFFARISSPEVH
jgi:hypothetical protein